MSAVGLNSKEEFSEGKPVIHEDPNSKSHLEALFDVLNETTTPPVKPPGKKFPENVPMIQRQFPDSFFNPSKFGPVGVSSLPAHHNRSISMPASIGDTRHRQYSVDNNVQGQIPPGWEEAQTPDGISYFIDHNNKTTTWEDPRKLVQMGRAPVHSPHLHMPPYQQPSMHQALHQQNSGSNQSIDSVPLPDGWQKAYTADGESYYVNHKNRTTSWFHPGASHHHHSHSFAGVPPRIGQQVYPGYHHQGGMGAMQGRIPYEAHRQPDILQQQQQQQQPMEVNRAPSLYNDPYLSSNNHIRQASHDSGLGVTAMPYSSDVGMEFDDGMDTGTPSVKVPLHPEYLENMPATDIDADQQMDSNLGQWV